MSDNIQTATAQASHWYKSVPFTSHFRNRQCNRKDGDGEEKFNPQTLNISVHRKGVGGEARQHIVRFDVPVGRKKFSHGQHAACHHILRYEYSA